MTTINILITLEYIGPYGGLEHFGLTLQVASDASTVDRDEQLLRPWLWSFKPTGPDTSTQPHSELWKFQDGNTTLTQIVNTSAGNPGPAAAKLIAKLNAQFEALRSSKANNPFGWTSDPRGNPESAAVLPKQQKAYRWPAQLAQVGRYPYPIPHQLNLSYFFTVNAPLPTTDYLVAAPTFIANGILYSPTPSVGSRNSDGTVTISYSAQPTDPTGTTVQAIVQPISGADCKLNVRSASSGTPIAKQDPYLSLPHPEDSAWQHDLLPLAAEFFDPSARFIGAFRLVMPQNQVPGASQPARNSDFDTLYVAIQDHFETFRQSIVISLRDVADCGTQQAPGNVRNQDSQTGPSLLSRVLGAWVNVLSDSDQQKAQKFGDALVSVLKGNLGQISPSDWAMLLGKIPNLAGNPMLGAVGDKPSDAEKNREFLKRLIALENLHLCFTQNEVLKGIVTAQWDYCYGLPQVKSALDGTDKDGNLWRSFRQSADDQLTRMDLRQQFTAGNLGSNWNSVLSEMTKALSTSPQTNTLSASKTALRTALSSALCAELSKYLNGELLTALLKCLFNKSSCAAAGGTSSWVNTQLQSIVKDASDPQAADAKRQRTRVSEGITLALDTLSSQDSVTDDPDDSLRSMVGLCVLARESNSMSKEWKCLNFAIACLDREAKEVLTPSGAVIPIPLHNQAGLRNAMITYNNRPIMGLSPEMQFGDNLTSQDTTRLIEYLHPSLVTGSPVDGKLPGLAFGNSYDFLAGLVRSSLALPNLFADPTDPGMLGLKTNDHDRLRALETVFATHGVSTKYLRTVPIGELRFGNDSLGFNQKFGLPVIPPEVQPRARDLEKTVPPRDGTETPGTQPVILLTDYAPAQSLGVSQFVFSVFKSTTDIRTWDAWVAAKGIDPTTRVSMWADYHKLSNEQADGGSAKDLSIDDPAIDQLQVKVEWLDGGVSATTVRLPWPGSTGTNSLASLRSGPITISVVVSNGAPTLSLADKNSIQLVVPPGTLARLTLTPTLRDTNLFANGILAAQNLGPSYGFLIETADTGKIDANGKIIESALPSIADLRSKLTAVGETDDVFAFALNVDPGSPPSKFRNIRYARLRLQSWRWDGRPCERFPWKADVTNGTAEVKKWEATAFAGRSIHDSNIRTMSIDAAGKSLRAIEDISTYRGVLYFRYGVEVFNRYGPLVPPKQRSVDSLGDELDQPLWSRCLVPLRWHGEIPKPAVKLVLPLTSSLRRSDMQTPNKTASLMVVLQGPWYSIGGLAEQMKAELLYTGASGQLPEAGPDPIRWAGKKDQLVASYSLGETFDAQRKEMHLDGPIGHTFDDSDTNPLWVNCSFVLPPIQAEDGSHNALDTPWDLAKVRFRRIFDSEAPISKLSPGGDTASKPTDPYWVQFLPNYEYLNGDVSSPASQAVLVVDPDPNNKANVTITIKNRANNLPITLRKGKNLLHFLLVTKIVPDLLGRVDQERVIDIVQSLDGKSWRLNSTNARTGDRLIGRVVEIQVAPYQTIDNSSSLWDALFPDDPAKDAVGEIVGFSPPIYPTTDKSGTCEPGSPQ